MISFSRNKLINSSLKQFSCLFLFCLEELKNLAVSMLIVK